MKTKAAFTLAWQLFGSKGKTDLYSFIPFKAAGGVKTISHKLTLDDRAISQSLLIYKNNTLISKFSIFSTLHTTVCSYHSSGPEN